MFNDCSKIAYRLFEVFCHCVCPVCIVYTRTCILCMKMHCYFLLNIKHEASQLYLGGGSLQLSSDGTDHASIRLPFTCGCRSGQLMFPQTKRLTAPWDLSFDLEVDKLPADFVVCDVTVQRRQTSWSCWRARRRYMDTTCWVDRKPFTQLFSAQLSDKRRCVHVLS